jgi:hypothetical protein
MAEIFAGEIEGLVSLAAQNVAVEVQLSDPRFAGVSFLQSYAVEKTDEGGWRVRLHDLYATSPKAVGLLLHVEDVRELGKVKLGEVRVEADVVTEAGIEHRTTVMPVVANLDSEDHVEPTVEHTFLRFQAAKAREDAVRLADQGDFDRAAKGLEAAASALAPVALHAEAVEEVEDLQREAGRLRARLYEASDRKYQSARAMAARDLKADYAARVSRRPRKQ